MALRLHSLLRCYFPFSLCRMEDKGYWLWLAKVSRSFLFVYIALGYAVLESCVQNFVIHRPCFGEEWCAQALLVQVNEADLFPLLP